MLESGDESNWRISSFSGMNNCVAVAATGSGVSVRNSKAASAANVSFTADEWRAFVHGVKAGEFDLDDGGAFAG
ncbi:DUF397 domain-containing protein [Kineosporia babensis]|nr:DUF397 domain-containing protein [Kineosporia babensis]